MLMKRYIMLLCVCSLAFLTSCRQDEDSRYFAPEISFDQESYTVSLDESVVQEVKVLLSRPATQELTVGVVASSSLKEDVQYKLSSTSLTVPVGASEAALRIDLITDEIWDEEGWIELALSPGLRYTINPSSNCMAKVNVRKTIDMPQLKLVAAGEPEINPFLAEALQFTITSDRAPRTAIDIELSLGDLVCGTDYFINGGSSSSVSLEAGKQKVDFELTFSKIDQSGFDLSVPLSLKMKKGVYAPVSGESELTVRLYDPQVDFSGLLKSAALQNGAGYQIRQAIKGADGEWKGNTQVDLGRSAEGSNYLSCYRNMYDHPSFGCRANSSVSQPFRINEFFPNYLYPNATAIIDYGNDQNHREFTPVDSLMRFVLNKGETKKGSICLTKARTFTAIIGNYAKWQADVAGGKAWVVDSKANNGNILASTHEAIEGRISITLEKLEGSFDFTNSNEPVLVTAWFSSDSEMFMVADTANGKDPVSTYGLTQENGLWRVEYKLWPR